MPTPQVKGKGLLDREHVDEQIARIDADITTLRASLIGTQVTVTEVQTDVRTVKEDVRSLADAVEMLRVPVEAAQAAKALLDAKVRLINDLGARIAKFHQENPMLRVKSAVFYEIGLHVSASADVVVR